MLNSVHASLSTQLSWLVSRYDIKLWYSLCSFTYLVQLIDTEHYRSCMPYNDFFLKSNVNQQVNGLGVLVDQSSHWVAHYCNWANHHCLLQLLSRSLSIRPHQGWVSGYVDHHPCSPRIDHHPQSLVACKLLFAAQKRIHAKAHSNRT